MAAQLIEQWYVVQTFAVTFAMQMLQDYFALKKWRTDSFLFYLADFQIHTWHERDEIWVLDLNRPGFKFQLCPY